MANNNLFYQLYNKGNKNFIGANYICPDVVDETQTGFKIDDSQAVIVDSNGDTLQSIDLSGVFADGITEYHTETKILQPNTIYYIQGLNFGESYAQHYFKLCEHLTKDKEELFSNYINLEFDLCYTVDFEPVNLHVSTRTKREGEDYESPLDVIDIINEIFCDYDLPFKASLELVDVTTCSGEPQYYIKFISERLGIEYTISNMVALPIYQTSDYIYSPFVHDSITVQDVIDALTDVKPGEDKTKIDCNLYVYLLSNLEDLFDSVVNTGTTTRKDIPDGFTAQDIVDVIDKIVDNTGLHTTADNSLYLHRLKEDYDLQVGSLKYPNGAMRGIVLVPEYPEKADEQKACLKIHHIKDQITLYEPVYTVDPDIKDYDEETKNDYFQIFEFVKDGKKVKTLVRYEEKDNVEPISDVYKIPANWDGRISSLILYRTKKDNDLLKKYDGVDFYYIVTFDVDGKENKFLVKWVNDGHPENVEDVLYTMPENWDGKFETLKKVDLSLYDEQWSKPIDVNALPSELYKRLDVKTGEKIPGSAEYYNNQYFLRWINDGSNDLRDLYVRVEYNGVITYEAFDPSISMLYANNEDVQEYTDVIDEDVVNYVEYPEDIEETPCKAPQLLYEQRLYRVLASYKDYENKTCKGNCNALNTVADINDAYAKYQKHLQLTCKTCYTNNELNKHIAESCGCYDDPRGIIGYYGYIDHVNKNNDWLNVGQLYAIVGGKDSDSDNDRNMVPSMLLYNPYDVPVRVKYMLFV